MLINRHMKTPAVISIFFAAAIAVAGCSHTQVKPPGEEEMYKEANRSLEGPWYDIDYQRAIDDFQKVIDTFPYSNYALLAELKIADAYFKKEDYLTAVDHYKEFKKKHPKNEKVPYAVYRTGLSYHELSLSYDRDQVSTENAVVFFSELISTFPECEYAADSEKRRRECIETLAHNIMYIGMQYFRRGSYQPAAARFEELLEKYPDSSFEEKALYHAAESHFRSNSLDRAADMFRRLAEKFPRGRRAGEARGRLEELKGR